MGLAAWLELIKGVLEFPDKILAIVRLFRKTPAEKHEELLQGTERLSENLRKTGRPIWDSNE